MNRPRFAFRPNLQNEDHRRAWEALTAVPEGQRNAFLVRAILQSVREDAMEEILRRVIREELGTAPLSPSQPVEAKEEIPEDMLCFIGSLLDED